MPVCAIAGNLLININITLVSILGISLIIKNNRFFFFKEYLELIFLSFFFLISFLIIIYFKALIPKSFLIIKFLIYTVSIVYFLKNNKNVLNKIFIFYSVICLILAIDVIFQSYFLKNIFGIKNIYNYNSSFYGEEKLAGFHILFFSFFSIFFLTDIFKNRTLNNLSLLFILVVVPFSIYLSLNRISFIIYFLGLLIYFFLSNFRKKVLVLISLPLFTFLILSHPDKKYKKIYQSFFNHGSMIVEKTLETYSDINKIAQFKKNNSELEIQKRYTGTGHAVLFSNALFIWKENKWLGVGYKQFYKKCRELNSHICSTHPHNIYLDILVSFGVFGLLPFAIMLIVLLKKSIKIIILQKYNHKIIHSLFITNIMFFFPLQSSGSILKSYLGFYAFTLIALSIYVFNMKEKSK